MLQITTIILFFVLGFLLAKLIMTYKIKALEANLENKIVELTENHKTLETLMYSMAHDLKSPVRSAAGLVEALQEDILDEAGTKESNLNILRLTITSLNSGLNNVDDILDFIKFGQNLEIQSNQNIQEEILLLITEFQNLYPKAHLSVLPLNLVTCDKMGLKRVFQNLIENGLKYNSKKNKFIKIYQEENSIIVEDNGNGIEEKYLNRIIQPFQRLDSRTKGSGLGLAIVVKILELHGYKLEIESKINVGSKFKIIL